jgi:hypothetical protein
LQIDQAQNIAPAKKRRFRFSLRTLLIVMLLYALCWTLTATWGVSDVLKTYQQKNRTVLSTGNNDVFIRRVDSDGSTYEWKVRAISPAPFYIKEVTHGQMPDGLQYDRENSYLWFFGYRFWLNRPTDALRKR